MIVFIDGLLKQIHIVLNHMADLRSDNSTAMLVTIQVWQAVSPWELTMSVEQTQIICVSRNWLKKKSLIQNV